MPHVLVRRNMLKVHGVLAQVDEVLGGLTRGLDLSLLDTGIGMVAGRAISFFPRGDSMGVVLPNNSPGVHSLWAPTTVLKIPLVLKPGSAEPWTPFRMIQAWLAGGLPARGVQLLSVRSRRRQRDPAPHRPRHGVRRRQGDRALAQGRRPRRDPRAGLQQGDPRRRRARQLGAAHRHDRGVGRRQRRPLVRQRVGRVGDRARAARSPRRWRRSWRRSRRAPPTTRPPGSRRSSIRRWPSASRR